VPNLKSAGERGRLFRGERAASNLCRLTSALNKHMAEHDAGQKLGRAYGPWSAIAGYYKKGRLGVEHKTMLGVYVTIDTAERLDEAARERHISITALVREVITTFVYGKPVPLAPSRRGNFDGRNDEALAIIRSYPHGMLPPLATAVEGCRYRAWT
jgi:hypothetical protein